MDWGKGKWDGAGGNASEGEWQMKLCLGSPAIHLLLCGPVPIRLWATGLQPRVWGLLH